MRVEHPSMRGQRLRAYAAPAADGLYVRVTGELDYATSHLLRHALRTAIGQGVAAVVVDLHGLWESAPVAGVAAFVDAGRLARARGVALAAVHVPPSLLTALAGTYVDGLPVAGSLVALPA